MGTAPLQVSSKSAVKKGVLIVMCNTQSRIVLTVTLIIIASVYQAVAGIPPSYLQPEDGVFGYTEHNPYLMSVGERLLFAPGVRKCQAVFLPSFSPESAVYIQYDYDDPTTAPVVISLKLEKHLWYEMQILIQSIAKSPSSYSAGQEAQRKVLPLIQISVNRLEAPIENKVAKTLEQVWVTMLTQTHYPKKSHIGLDGETSHFANFTEGLGYQTGKTWSPSKGTINYKFIELAKALQNYPNLQKEKRAEAAQEMFSAAQILLEHLNK